MVPPVRRLSRISLRTLFVLMTVFAVWLGYLSKCAHDQRVVLRRVKELGGTVGFDFQFEGGDPSSKGLTNPQPPGWSWLRNLIGPEYFQNVVRLNLDKKAVDDDDLTHIGKLHRIGNLSLDETNVSDIGLKQLGALNRLRYLCLSGSQVTGDGLLILKEFRDLDTLNLGDCHGVDDAAIEHVKALTKLEELNLYGTSVTSDGVAQLAALPNLRSLWLSHSAVDDNAVKAFVNIKSLIELNLEDAQLSGAGLMDLRTQLPNCLVYCDMVNLHGSKISQSRTGWQKMVTRLQSLNQENRLKLLDASNSKIGDEQLRDFYQLNNLQAINLQNTAVTLSGVDKLKKALPRCTCRY